MAALHALVASLVLGALLLWWLLPWGGGEKGSRGEGGRREGATPRAAKRRLRSSLSRLPPRVDAIVVGSGPSGLGVAALLAKRGKAVLVLEANEALGGGMHSWTHEGVRFDTGFHYLGEVHQKSSPLCRLLEYVAPGLEWAAMADCPHSPGVYDELHIASTTLTFRPGEQLWEKELCRVFPHEKRAIRSFLQLCKRSVAGFLPGVIWRSIRSPILRGWLKSLLLGPSRKLREKSVEEALDPLSSDPRLKGVLSYLMLGCCGVGPSEGSFASLAGVTSHFMQGGAYPRGGAQAVVDALVDTVERGGGAACVRAGVSHVLTGEGGEVIGVQLRNGTEVKAPLVVSTIGTHLTLHTLLQALPPEHSKAVNSAQSRLSLAHLSLTRGHLNLFATFHGSTADLGLPRHNTWRFPQFDHDAQASHLKSLSLRDALEMKEPWVYVGMAFPSAKDPAWGEGGGEHARISSAVVIAEVPTSWWAEWDRTSVGHRGQEYEEIKQALQVKLLALLYARFPQLEGKLRSVSLGTPLSTKYYLNKESGESYGLQPTPNLFAQQEAWLRPDCSGVPGLYLAGQDINFDGLAGALLSAVICVAVMEGPGVWLSIARAIGLKTLLKELIWGGSDLSTQYSAYQSRDPNMT